MQQIKRLAVFVGAEIVHHEDITRIESGQQNIAYVSPKNFRIDCPFDGHAGSAAVLPDRADHGGGAPATTGSAGMKAFASRTKAAQPRHVRLGRRFIEEHEP